VIKIISYKTLMTVSAKKNLHICHMNVITAFLYEMLDETVHIEQSHTY
jgi:hypothetical protein